MIRQLTALPSQTTVTIPSGTDVVIDMKGYKINQNNNLFFINNGTLKITDSSQTPGEIETFKNNVIENNGTLTIENIKIYSVSNGDTLFTNNLNATATLTNVNMSNLEYKIIENKGNSIRVVHNEGRNKIYEYRGKIIEVYPNIFIVKVDENKNSNHSQVLTFSAFQIILTIVNA